jgi:hypothetical protein
MNRVVYRSFFMSYLVLTICYTYDLYLFLKNPLYPAKKRMRIYTASVLISIILLNICEGFLSQGSGPDIIAQFKLNMDPNTGTENILSLRHSMAETRSTWMILLLVPMLIFVIVTVRSVAKACRSFKKPGLGQNVRNLVLYKHIYIVTVGLVCNFPIVISQGFVMFDARFLSKDLNSATESFGKMNYNKL